MSPPGRNKITQTFDEARLEVKIRPAKRRSKTLPAPYSIRFDDEERARLNRDAGGLSWAAYIRSRLFPEIQQPKQRLTRKRRKLDVDESKLAQVLGALGQSRLSSNLNQIAKGANLGTLPVTPQLEDELKQACADIDKMRSALISALGIKEQ